MFREKHLRALKFVEYEIKYHENRMAFLIDKMYRITQENPGDISYRKAEKKYNFHKRQAEQFKDILSLIGEAPEKAVEVTNDQTASN